MPVTEPSVLRPLPADLRKRIAARPPCERAAWWALIWSCRVLVALGVPERWLVAVVRPALQGRRP